MDTQELQVTVEEVGNQVIQDSKVIVEYQVTMEFQGIQVQKAFKVTREFQSVKVIRVGQTIHEYQDAMESVVTHVILKCLDVVPEKANTWDIAESIAKAVTLEYRDIANSN